METANETRETILKYILDEFKNTFGEYPEVVASAPGRLDFLNTHQDYKGLPVVSVAINKRTYVALSTRQNTAKVVSLNLCMEGAECVDEFDLRSPQLKGGRFFGDYVRSVVRALLERGYNISGFNALIYSEIPIASGLASSAALQVSLITGLSELYDLNLDKKDIAELAYYSEHDIMSVPCGRLDQYGSAMGGITRIETKPPYITKTYAGFNWVFIVLYSGIRHSTAEIHPRRIREIEEGLRSLLKQPGIPGYLRRKLAEKIDEVLWEDLTLEELQPYLEYIDTESRKRIVFTIKMNISTKLAVELLENPSSKASKNALRDFLEYECPNCLKPVVELHADEVLELIAGVVNYQHILLRDLYDVSLPELELIRNTALSAGALGVKISGAGLGGSLLALAPDKSSAEKVAMATRGVTKAAWVVEVDEGTRVDLVES
ncbi:MAG: galactokinase family protein [Desulfurococcaceae archaeon]